MRLFETIVVIAGGISTICTAFVLLCKPIRDRLVRDGGQREGVKCLLRCQILASYYRNKDKQQIRQYEAENFVHCYDAYKALGGNSFIDKINAEVREWEVIT